MKFENGITKQQKEEMFHSLPLQRLHPQAIPYSYNVTSLGVFWFV
jgi:hypothetical protein